MKKLLILLIPLFMSQQCDPNMFGAGKAVKNLVTSPYRGIKGLITDKQYENKEEKTLDFKKNGPKYYDVKCKRTSAKAGSDLGIFADIQDHIRETICSCRPWGSCTTSECSCDKLCPDNLDIFSRRKIQENSSKENSLAFRNVEVISDKYEMTQGFCWGHASVTSKFNRLAFYDKDKKPPYSLSGSSVAEQDKSVDYYKGLIDKVVNNETVNIPGFKDLHDLSDHPALSGYIGDKVAVSWADRAMTFQAAGVGLQSTPSSRKENEKFFYDIKTKIDLNQQPQIVFTKSGARIYTHAVLVSHYEEDSNGKLTLCIRDNNSSPNRNKSCKNRMQIKKDGSVHYNTWPWNEIGGISIAHNDNGDAVEQIDALKEKCAKDKGCGK